MQLDDLKSPGLMPEAPRLRTAAFRAITYTRILADLSPESDAGNTLREFFLDCAKKCPKPKKEPSHEG